MSVTVARSVLANEVKRAKRKADPESEARVADACRELAAAKLEAYIRAAVAAAPPLTSEMRDRLTVLLRDVS